MPQRMQPMRWVQELVSVPKRLQRMYHSQITRNWFHFGDLSIHMSH
jgi:hypothetical protein